MSMGEGAGGRHGFLSVISVMHRHTISTETRRHSNFIPADESNIESPYIPTDHAIYTRTICRDPRTASSSFKFGSSAIPEPSRAGQVLVTVSAVIMGSNLTRESGRLHSFSNWDAACPKRDRGKIVIAVAVELQNGYGLKSSDASGDLWLLLDQDLKEHLQDPTALIIILTERLDLKWLGDFKATIVGDIPTRANIRFATETIASQCAPGGDCLIWNANSLRPAARFQPMDGWELAVTGQDMKTWVSKMNPSCRLKVVLEVCHAGNFMGLPYEFAANGELVAMGRSAAPAFDGPHIIFISACHKYEKAWVGKWQEKKCGAFTLMLKCIMYAQIRAKESPIRLKEIERLVTPQLKDWGVQRPLVAMSHADPADREAILTFP
ncbi:hypothetical protein FRB97_002095 [Tulasnella sp. 331]|nr:hypothetical protein FRB97_002095 [Tulasnella sp. 331]